MIASPRLLPWSFAFAAVLVVGCAEESSKEGAEAARITKIHVSPKQAEPILELTPAAAMKVREIIREGQASGALPNEQMSLRVRVVAGGCCGFLHKLDMDPDLGLEGVAFTTMGVRVVVTRRQVEMLRGTKIDYTTLGKETGFTVKNPNFEGKALEKWLPLLQAQEKAG